MRPGGHGVCKRTSASSRFSRTTIMIGIGLDEDVATLRIRSVHKRVDDEFPNYRFIIDWDRLTEQTGGQLLCLAKVKHLGPHGIDKLHRRQCVIVPNDLIEPQFALVVLQELDDGRPTEGRRDARGDRYRGCRDW
jgi:hypothetical protein